MGSLMMHYCILNELGKKLKINENRFIMGMLSTDICHLEKEPKNKSHFMTVDENRIRHIDYYDFYKKYKNQFDDSFFLGYFCHLISDDVWHNERVPMKINKLSPEEKSIAKVKFLKDLKRSNSMIVNHFKIENKIPFIEDLEVIEAINTVKIDEINIKLLPDMLTQLNQHFEFAAQIQNEPLELFCFDEINEYINKAISISYDKLSQVISR